MAARRLALPRDADAALAAVLVVLSVGVLVWAGLFSSADKAVSATATIVVAALVAWRRRLPNLVATLVGGFTALAFVIPGGTSVETPADDVLGVVGAAVVFLCAYSLGAERRWATGLIGLVPLTAGFAVTAGSSFNPLAEMLTVGPWLGGLVVASRRRTAEELEVRGQELEAEREVFAQQSVRYERAQIARELHDIVAHCVSLMVVQANAGAHLAHQDPRGAAEAFDSISEAARQAEVEIDRLMDLLDTSESPAVPASLLIVEDLARRVGESGVSVTCQLLGDCDHLDGLCSETVYRLVQESVTNAMKHAPGGPISIVVSGGAAFLDVEVVNGPPAAGRAGLAGLGGGHGLAGMRERALRCGGECEAGPVAGGGWRVAARLPRRTVAFDAPAPAALAPAVP